MKAWTESVRAGEVLGPDEVAAVVAELLSPSVGDEAKADFLESLHRRGETPEEVGAFASAFLTHAEPFDVPTDIGGVMDVCGTGGDRLGLFNVSTAVMFVAAGAGARLVKHGNRGITSRSGGADVLEALGVPLDAPVDRLHAMLQEAGAVFLFAPRFHPAFKAVATSRKILAVRGSASIFNMLGPLLNPARPTYQLTGVFAASLLPVYAGVLPGLGRKRAWVVHGRAGGDGVVDEVSTMGSTLVAELGPEGVVHREWSPADLGVEPGVMEDLRGGDATENAGILLGLLSGERRGSARDLVVVNTAAALQVAGRASGWAEAKSQAEQSIDSGAALSVLQGLRRVGGAG